jgi:hypothetical protein
MTNGDTADTAHYAAVIPLDRQNPQPRLPSTVEFDVDYSQGVELVVRLGSPATVQLIFKDQMGSVLSGPGSGATIINDSPATFSAMLSADRQSVLIVPRALGSTIIHYVYCECLTASLIVRITNSIGPLRPTISVRDAVFYYLNSIEADYRIRTIDDIIGCVKVDRQLVEATLEALVRDGLVRQSGDFWPPLNSGFSFVGLDLSSDNFYDPGSGTKQKRRTQRQPSRFRTC